MAAEVDSSPEALALQGQASKLSRDELRQIHRRYGAAMWRRCRTIMRSDAAADDALQEAFMNLIRYGQAFREAQKKLPWLYQVCQRACWAELKRRQRAPEPMATLPEEPLAEVDDLEDQDQVMKILLALEPKERDLAVMVWVEERSQGDAAEHLGWSRQTVNKRLKQIRAFARARAEQP